MNGLVYEQRPLGAAGSAGKAKVCKSEKEL